MMNLLAGMGLAGSAVLALWLLASKILKTRLPARWHYRVLKTSLLFFLVPVGRILPLAGRALAALRPVPAAPAPVTPSPVVPYIPVAVIPQTPVTLPANPAPAPLPAPEPFAFSAEALRVLAVVWAIGAAGMLAYKACVYLRLRRQVFRQSRPVSSREAQLVFWSCKRQLGVRGAVDLRENPAIRSPFAAGLRRPAVVIPAVALGREELRYLFLHELTHIKSGDLWVRFLAMLAQVLHWYNPLTYLLCRNIQTISEQSCDERVACPLTAEERYVYGGVIMKLAAGGAAGSGDWAASLSTRESIERRLIRVLRTEKLKGCKRLAALALAAVILACGGGAALAARNPLPVSEKEAAEPARTVPTVSDVSAGDTGKTGGSAVKPGGAAPAAADPQEGEEAEDAKTEKAVTYNGTPSEEFLKELREYFATVCHIPGITEDTPVRFGDHALIVSRGGTLLPDEEFSSYTCSYGGSENAPPVIYKVFRTKPHTVARSINESGTAAAICEEYFVGNKDALIEPKLRALDELVNGEYPKNSKGESYGSEGLGNYVGYYPDLISAVGTKGESGYLYRPDEDSIPHNLPKSECPHNFLVPLYDKEHNEIGKFKMSCGGHFMEDVIAQGMSIEDAKAALANAPATYDDPSEETLAMIRKEYAAQSPSAPITESTPILFGDKDLIIRHGGTILPDNELGSYSMVDGTIYKYFMDKNGGYRREYPVGNKDLVDFPNQLKQLTADGDYPKNSKGESYGSQSLAEYVGYEPDLQFLAEYPHEKRPAGYIRDSDLRKPLPEHTAEECAGKYPIPLYNPEGEVIGKEMLGCTGQHIDITGMSIEDVKAAMAAGATTTEEAKAAAAAAKQNGGGAQSDVYQGYWESDGTWFGKKVIRGDSDLIRSRGGTILPEEGGSYYGKGDELYKFYLDRDGNRRLEYRVGNKDALREEEKSLLNTLVKGEYPKNTKGESYGYECLADYVGYAPDLAVWVDGPEQGYWRQKELEDKADALHYACKCPGEFEIPLYASDGKTVKTRVTYICPYSVHLE